MSQADFSRNDCKSLTTLSAILFTLCNISVEFLFCNHSHGVNPVVNCGACPAMIFFLRPERGGLMGDSNPPRCGGRAYVALSGRRPF
ncbi:MAG: hypothetical protein LBE12_04795 [Planctomycetaceae bacterium]|nr:hypothetical protein [Planctomycetaceae bacterium]